MAALVEPPQASTQVTALSNEEGVRRFFGEASSHTNSTARLPVAVAIFAWWESAAGIDAAPGSARPSASAAEVMVDAVDRKSTRLNSSHSQISYAVFCLKKKKTETN